MLVFPSFRTTFHSLFINTPAANREGTMALKQSILSLSVFIGLLSVAGISLIEFSFCLIFLPLEASLKNSLFMTCLTSHSPYREQLKLKLERTTASEWTLFPKWYVCIWNSSMFLRQYLLTVLYNTVLLFFSYYLHDFSLFIRKCSIAKKSAAQIT